MLLASDVDWVVLSSLSRGVVLNEMEVDRGRSAPLVMVMVCSDFVGGDGGFAEAGVGAEGAEGAEGTTVAGAEGATPAAGTAKDGDAAKKDDKAKSKEQATEKKQPEKK